MATTPRIIGYHCNDKYRCEDFLNDFKMINSEDEQYLGTGMYFWDNYSNAEYWLSKKKTKHQEIEEWYIVSALIKILMLLDLTDKEQSYMLDGLWRKYCSRTRTHKDLPLGIKIDNIFKFFKLYSRYHIIKANAAYNDMENPNILSGTYVQNNTRTLYCVKNASVVTQSKLEHIEKVC